MKYVKWIAGLVTLGISIISISEIISYLKTPSSYMLGSESMVGNGGIYYSSVTMFFVINSIHIVVSFIAILLLLKAKEIAVMIIVVMLVLLQVLLFVIM